MTLNRWRGTGGVLGWLVLRWDVWQIRRQMRRGSRVSEAWLDDHHRR